MGRRLEGVKVARCRSVILAGWVADFMKVGINKLLLDMFWGAKAGISPLGSSCLGIPSSGGGMCTLSLWPAELLSKRPSGWVNRKILPELL